MILIMIKIVDIMIIAIIIMVTIIMIRSMKKGKTTTAIISIKNKTIIMTVIKTISVIMITW